MPKQILTIREKQEECEKNNLSNKATLSVNSKGRKGSNEQSKYRTVFQRDRDRIIHCKSFRRLMHKTQVFLSPEGDHFRTRLTHTLEVSQIARTIARALYLNEDLTEAISYGHDLGHTPFGHAGERSLDSLMMKHLNTRFRHYEQSVRVVEHLESDGKGLDLTYEVLDGIENHSSERIPMTLEGEVVQIADRVAYVNHDLDDAIRAGILSNNDVPKEIRNVLGETSNRRIDTLITSIIENSNDKIEMDNETKKYFLKLRTFLFNKVYNHPVAKGEEKKVTFIIENLFDYFIKHKAEMPEEYIKIADEKGIYRAACDYIAGMTDNFALHKYTHLFIPNSWSGEI